jgi:type I restriction enzyme, S subunit
MMEKQFAESALALQLDKISWKKVSFGDVAMQQKKSVDREKTHLTKYVKGEHMGSEDLHLRSWGELADEYLGPAFIRFFEEGDILYGSRRTYLRKVAIAPFEGITSNTTFVIKANEEVIDKRLLPFVMLSEGFAEHSIKNSKGSVNPYINWKDIANYQFLLPPKAEQARLAELLWAMDEVIEKEKEVLGRLEVSLSVKASDLIWKSNHKLNPLISFATGSIGKLVDGDWIESKDQSNEGIRLLQLADIGVGDFINKSRRYISEETFKRLRCFEVLPEDVLIARMPDPIGRACIVENIGSKMITAVDCCIARVDSNNSSNKYLLYLLNTTEFLHKANLLASGTTRQRIARKSLEEIKVPKPALKNQLEIVEVLELLSKGISNAKTKISASQSLQKSLINQIF